MELIRRVLPYLLAISCLLTGGYYLSESVKSFDYSNDIVSPWEKRIGPIREALPADVFVVSYLEKADIPDTSAEYDEAEFFLVQYGVAPIVILPGFGQKWIIGNFGNAAPLESIRLWLDQELGKNTVLDLGFGIYLIHDIEE